MRATFASRDEVEATSAEAAAISARSIVRSDRSELLELACGEPPGRRGGVRPHLLRLRGARDDRADPGRGRERRERELVQRAAARLRERGERLDALEALVLDLAT